MIVLHDDAGSFQNCRLIFMRDEIVTISANERQSHRAIDVFFFPITVGGGTQLSISALS